MPSRVILVAVDDTDTSQMMFGWVIMNALRPDDQLHLLHVTLRDCGSDCHVNLPGSDYFEQAHPETAQKIVLDMLQQRFLSGLQAQCPGLEPVIHIVQGSMDAKTVGQIICRKAEQLKAEQVYISEAANAAAHTKLHGLLKPATVAEFCKHHCKPPLTIVANAHEAGIGAAAVPSAKHHD